MASKTFAGFTGGIDRSRHVASAKLSAFWDLLNCFVDPSRTIVKRPGFKHVGTLDAGTHGLFANAGSLRTFYSTGDLTAPSWDVNITYHALRLPPNADGTAATLDTVYCDYLFIGKQYVAAKFSDDVIRHYWLQDPDAWKADTVYDVGALVQPATPNGYYFVAEPTDPPPAWQPEVAYAVGDAVQPTTYNGFKYTVTSRGGDSPRSGDVEPDWIASDGALVQEYVDDSASTTAPTPSPGTPDDEYGNYPGAGT